MIANEQILAELRPAAVPEHYGIKFKICGDELRTRHCPACGQRSTDAVAINVDSGLWCCHVCGARGDVFALVAGYAGLDARRDFVKVKELAAQIAGISSAASDPDLVRRLAERRRQEELRRVQEQAERAAAVASMPARWEALDRRSLVGERYLEGRGLDPSELRHVVRFSPQGDPALALRDLETGTVTGIQYRKLHGEPKLISEKGSRIAGSALHGKLTDIDPDGVDVAVIVEGLADTLAAALAFPGCAIYGAPGAGQMARIAAAVAPRVAAARGWLLMTVDADSTGIAAGSDAIVEAVRGGLRLADGDAGLDGAGTIRLIDLGDHHDLADAYAAGWRYTWPGQVAS